MTGDLLRLWDEKVLVAVMAACEERWKEDAKTDDEDRRAMRSKFSPFVADAMAKQWG